MSPTEGAQFETDRPPGGRGLGVRIAVFAAAVACGFHVAIDWFSSHERIAEPAQQVRLLDEPPPPPPPEPEPEPVVEETAQALEQEFAPLDEPPPAGDALGLDAEGDAGGDQFGLAARKGGRDLLTITGEGAGNGAAEAAWRSFAGRLERALERAFELRDELRDARYDVTVRVWIEPDGTVVRAELAGSTGDRRRDELLEQALLESRAGTPPADMPQPLRLRIRSRLG
jgi:outer membrane biosynthesis protein TonB